MKTVDPSLAVLVIEDGPLAGKQFSLRLALQSQLLIGRHSDCQIHIPTRDPPDPYLKVSRRHAAIEVRPDGVFLHGLSEQGTLVDGTTVGKDSTIQLQYGSRIQLTAEGPRLVLQEHIGKGTTAPPQANQTSPASQTFQTSPASVAELRAQVAKLTASNAELDRQYDRLRREKDELTQKYSALEGELRAVRQQVVSTSSSQVRAEVPEAAAAASELRDLFERFSQRLLELRELLSKPNESSTGLAKQAMPKLNQSILALGNLRDLLERLRLQRAP